VRALVSKFAAALVLLLLASCSRPSPHAAHAASPAAPVESPRAKREVRVTGTIQAVYFSKVLVPAIYGQGGSLTLTRIIPNGSRLKEGDPIAEFDAIQRQDSARDAQAKFDDLGHQVDQKRAQKRADADSRRGFASADPAAEASRLQFAVRPVLV
jgi:HlyD family secretion protein